VLVLFRIPRLTERTSGGDKRGGRKVSGQAPRSGEEGEEGEGLTGLETQEKAPESE